MPSAANGARFAATSESSTNWFAGREPVAGEGRAALARAHYRLGNKDSGELWLKSAWRDSKLNRSRQQALFKEFRGKLSKEDHAVRADHLIWLGRAHHSKAEALLPHMRKSQKALMNARILKSLRDGRGHQICTR